MALKCSDPNPFNAVLARNIVTYLSRYNKTGKTKKEIYEFVLPRTLRELGLKDDIVIDPNKSGNIPPKFDSFFSKKEKKKSRFPLIINDKNIRGKDDPKYKLYPYGWDDWRIKYVPTHDSVRRMTNDYDFIIKNKIQHNKNKIWQIELSHYNSLFPDITVYIGKGTISPKELISEKKTKNSFNEKKGLYFIKHNNSKENLYVGETDEFYTRFQDHKKNKNILWWVFLALDDEVSKSYSFDALHAAEALLISFWNEISYISNEKRGFDKEPNFLYLQQGIALVHACSSLFIWLIRRNKTGSDLFYKDFKISMKSWNIPFKKGTGGWGNGNAYLNDINKNK